MLAKLVVEGKEFDIEILDPKLQELITPKKKTGYERIDKNGMYYAAYPDGTVASYEDLNGSFSAGAYGTANYYYSNTVAENNVRADNLMRQLRRVAVEHRKNDNPTERFYIYYLKSTGMLQLRRDSDNRYIGPWFDSLHAGANAIEAFKDELIWYFTEYRDSL